MDKRLTETIKSKNAKFAMFVAFIGRKITEQHMLTYSRYCKCDMKSVQRELNYLVQKGILVATSYSYWNREYLFRQELFIQMAVYMLGKQKKLILEFEKLPLKRENEALIIWEIAEGYFADNEEIGYEIEEYFPYNESQLYLRYHLFDKPTLSLIIGMSDNEFVSYVENILADSLFTDNANTALFDTLDYLIEEYADSGYMYKSDNISYIGDLTSCYRYFYDGTFGQPFRAIPSYPYRVMQAIKCLYEGKPSVSVALFLEALKERNKRSKEKNMFGNPLMCFYLILAYKRNDSKQDRTRIEQFLKKKIAPEYHSLHPVRILASYLGSSEEVISANTFDFNWMYTTSNYPLTRYISEAIIGYYNLSPKPEKVPVYSILRHELSPYLNVGEEEKERLTAIYGGVPILPTIKKLEKWETILQDLAQLAGNEAEKPSATEQEQKTERIGYFMNFDGSYLEFRIQNRLKNGTWGAGKKASQHEFFHSTIKCMDEADRHIAASVGRRTISKAVPATIALPNLIGSDKVYTGQYSPYIQATIIEEKPYITINKEGDSIKISSNITPKNKDLVSCTDKVAIRRVTDTTFSVIDINTTQRRIADTIEKAETLPIESYPTLLKLLPQLSRSIEIHSNLLEGGSSLEKIEGDSLIHCTIDPYGNDYKINHYIRPLSGGNLTFLSGKGDKTIFDQTEEKRYQVDRNIRKEKENLQKITDILEDMQNSEIIELENLILNPQQMLPFVEWAAENEDICTLEWPEGKQIKINNVTQANFNITKGNNENWFAVEGEITLKDSDSINIYELLKLTSQGNLTGNYIKIDDGKYISLTNTLRKQIQRLEAISQLSRHNITVSAYNAGVLAETIRGNETTFKSDNSIEELVQKIKESESLEPQIPANLNATLRDYQYEGFRWITRMNHWGAGACLADDMGLGKTIQAITFLLHKAQEGPSLVVAPASVIMNWKNEIARFAPTLNTQILNNSTNREETLSKANSGDIVLTTYGLLPQEEKQLAETNWNVICLDEAHTIKNRQTKTSAVAMTLKAKSRIILTGTPIQNHLGEMWNLFQFLNPGLLGTFEQFSHKYITNANADLKSLRKIVQPFILRRTKMQVLDELPDKTEIILNIQLSDLEIIAYERLRSRVESELEGEEKLSVNALAEITQLRQAACSIQLTDKKWNGANSKIEALKELVAEITSEGNKVIIFSQFTSFLDIIAKELEKLGMEYLYLNGATPIKKREQMVASFQKGEKQIFAISLKAGGLGLNLTQANYVIHLDPWWNPAIEQQATDRAHRIGQKQPVTVYHLICSNTIEEKILRLQKTKSQMSDALLNGTNIAHTLTIEDLRALVSEH